MSGLVVLLLMVFIGRSRQGNPDADDPIEYLARYANFKHYSPSLRAVSEFAGYVKTSDQARVREVVATGMTAQAGWTVKQLTPTLKRYLHSPPLEVVFVDDRGSTIMISVVIHKQ